MAEATRRERWSHTVRLGQCVFLAMTGKSPSPGDLAPPGVFTGGRKKPRKLTPEEEAAHMEFTGKFMEQAYLAVYG